MIVQIRRKGLMNRLIQGMVKPVEAALSCSFPTKSVVGSGSIVGQATKPSFFFKISRKNHSCFS